MYLVVAGLPSVTSRKDRLKSADVNRHHASAWYHFETIDAANAYADDMLTRHPKWTVAVVNLMESMGLHKG